MLNLDSPEWAHLQQAYGTAEGIPALLKSLREFPSEADYESDPWFSLWNCLCHQGDVFDASFAAVPHIVKVLESSPDKATISMLLMPAAIEVARAKNLVDVPKGLLPDYELALSSLAKLAGTAAKRNWDASLGRAAMAAFAVSVGDIELAELLIEMPDDAVPDTIEWLQDR